MVKYRVYFESAKALENFKKENINGVKYSAAFDDEVSALIKTDTEDDFFNNIPDRADITGWRFLDIDGID